MSKVKQVIPVVTLIVLSLIISVIAFVSPSCSLYNWFNADDGYYYFTVARNIAAGLGSTFDGINLTNGYHPLWMLICVIIFFLFGGAGPILPLRVIVLIGGLLNVFSAVLLFRILGRVVQKPLAWVVAAIWVSLPAIQLVTTAQGLETGLAICLLFLLVERAQVWFGSDKTSPSNLQLIVFGVLTALALLARLDNLFYVGFICVFVLLRVRFRQRIFVTDWIAISFSAYFSWAILLLTGRSDIQDHAVFPLLFLGLAIRPFVLWLGGQYRQTVALKAEKKWMTVLRTLGWVLISSLVMMAVLYGINALNISIRFAKFLILVEGICSTLLLGLNHLLPGLINQRTEAESRGTNSISRIRWDGSRFKKLLREMLLVAAPVIVGLGSYLVYNRVRFQSWMPISGMMKHYWSTLSNSVYGRPRFFYDVFAWGGRVNPWGEVTDTFRAWAAKLTTLADQPWLTREASFCLLLGFTLIIVFLLLRFGRIAALDKLNRLFFPALLLGSLARASYYSLSGYVALRSWYWVLEKALLLILAALLLEILASRLVRFAWGSRLLNAGAGLLFLVLLVGSVRFGLHFTPLTIVPEQREACFQPVRDLEAATEPGALIGMTGSGSKGYFVQERTIVNLDGLINSRAYYDSVLNGTAADFLADMGLDYVYGMPEILLRSGPYDKLFADHLKQVRVFTNSEGLTLYRFIP